MGGGTHAQRERHRDHATQRSSLRAYSGVRSFAAGRTPAARTGRHMIDFARMLQAERRQAQQAERRQAASIAKAPPPRLVLTPLTPERLAAAELELPGVVRAVYYIPNFVSKAEEAALIALVQREPRAWTQLPMRSLQNWGGVPHPSGMIAEELPPHLASVARAVAAAFGGERPNQVLLNSYSKGQGIGAHRDGPLYAPTAAIVSLGSAGLRIMWR